MNQEQFETHIKETFEKVAHRVCKEKNSDYTNDNPNPFKNFESAEESFNVDDLTEYGFITRMNDKWSRIGNLTFKNIQGKTSMVKDESLQDAVEDMIGYLVIYHAWMRKKELQSPVKPVKNDNIIVGKQLSSPSTPKYNPPVHTEKRPPETYGYIPPKKLDWSEEDCDDIMTTDPRWVMDIPKNTYLFDGDREYGVCLSGNDVEAFKAFAGRKARGFVTITNAAEWVMSQYIENKSEEMAS